MRRPPALRVEPGVQLGQRDRHRDAKLVGQLRQNRRVIVLRPLRGSIRPGRRRQARRQPFVVHRMIREAQKMIAVRGDAAQISVRDGPRQQLVSQIRRIIGQLPVVGPRCPANAVEINGLNSGPLSTSWRTAASESSSTNRSRSSPALTRGDRSNQRSTACRTPAACSCRRTFDPRVCGMNLRVAVCGLGRRTRDDTTVPTDATVRGHASRPTRNWANQKRNIHTASGPLRSGQATYCAWRKSR